MKQMPQLPQIPESERTPAVDKLLDFIQLLVKEIQELRQENQLLRQENQLLKNEIAVLKGQKPKPSMLPNKLGKEPDGDGNRDDNNKKRPGSEKRKKTAELVIHEEIHVAAENVPQGSIRKGYNEFVVQTIKIETRNIRYLLERWQTPDGKYLVATLPKELGSSHFGPELIRYILYLHYQDHVTRPLILEHLLELGVDISSGQIDAILTIDKDQFHDEKDEILEVGLRNSKEIGVDDTIARHAGKNGFCTQIGSEFFTWFKSTDSKSRINFLQLLRGTATNYLISEDALKYMAQHDVSDTMMRRFKLELNRSFRDQNEWDNFLSSECNVGVQQRRTITEAALLGSIIFHGVPKDLVIQSDDAGQFAILIHGLCWVHAERHFRKIVPIDDQMRVKIEEIRDSIWTYYKELKEYKDNPSDEIKELLDQKFDQIFSQTTEYFIINRTLQSIKKNKAELLLVLKRPYVSLHNNGSEREIREYAKRRKISGGTRSDLGRQCRDTFTSLKKTCRKLGISFWQYLLDRITNRGEFPRLSDLIVQKSTSPPPRSVLC